MELTRQRQAFITLLKKVGVEDDTVIVVNLLLPEDEELLPIIDLIEENYQKMSPSELQSEILLKATEITKAESDTIEIGDGTVEIDYSEMNK